MTIDLIRSVQKSAAVQKEEAMKIKAIVATQQQQHQLQHVMEVEKKKLSDQEQELMTEYGKLQLEQKKAQVLLSEGNERLENSLKKGDYADVQAAYALNKSGTDKIKEINEAMTDIMNQVTSIQQKRIRAEREQSSKKQKLLID